MKHVINGVTYDTDVANVVMSFRTQTTTAPWVDLAETLYRAPGDIYFIVSTNKYGSTARRLTKDAAKMWQIDRIPHYIEK